MAKALMFQGTGSDVGKSLIVAGLCRAFLNRGLRVKPFKPQNMSNNAAVTIDGGEIGRAQALQAKACKLAPHSDMNPVLLKPQSQTGSQIIIQGQVWGQAGGNEYQKLKPGFLPRVLDSFERLKKGSDLILIEGAGSSAEINLRAGDIANMGFACVTDTPVFLIADIDRGGVIAQLIGTFDLFSSQERQLVCGYIVNKFRGDSRLFRNGLEFISQRIQRPSIGLVPYFPQACFLPPEDSSALSASDNRSARTADSVNKIKIVALVLPCIANFDEFDPLRAEKDIDFIMLSAGQALPGDTDLVILPGSKATLSDLQSLYREGWDIDLKAHLRRGGQIFGICGGYQMLGKHIFDPLGVEGSTESLNGLAFLDIETRIFPEKKLEEVTGKDLKFQTPVRGYHMHMGETKGLDCERALLKLNRTGFPHQPAIREGARSADGLVCGTYLHGLFAGEAFRQAFLNHLKKREASVISHDLQVEQTLDQLAEHLETCLDLDALWTAGTHI